MENWANNFVRYLHEISREHRMGELALVCILTYGVWFWGVISLLILAFRGWR